MNSIKLILSLSLPALRRNRALLSLVLVCATASIQAAAQSYLPAGLPDPVALLAPPPLAISTEQAADMASTVAVFKARTPQEELLCRSETKFTIFSFAPVIGPFFQPGKFPVTEAFFQQVQRETSAVTDSAKNFWKRPRPYMLDLELAAAGGALEKGYSYPSGHSTRAMVLGLLLAELFPDRKDSILEEGRNIGWHRVEIGRHYPTDIYAGRTLAQAIVREFKANPAFQADLAKVKDELARRQ
ncbi:MAG TPA: phosphatase PAP2 family protein [Verrucomicrobiae bacterium]|nr:phosphatase PAP2 family protein [Verrucomicrobiae bacterium]